MPSKLIIRKLKPWLIILVLIYLLTTPLSAAYIASLLLEDFTDSDKESVLLWTFVSLVAIPWLGGPSIVIWLRFFKRPKSTKRKAALRSSKKPGRATSITFR